MSGGGGGETQSSKPWGGQEPYIRELYRLAEQAYNQTPRDAFGGSLYVGPSDQTQQAQQWQQQLANSMWGQGDQAVQLGQDTLAGKYLDIDNNKYAQGAINAAIDPVQQQYQEQIIPQLQSAAISGGAYGGDREAILGAQAAEGFARQAGNISGSMAGDFYNRERALQQAAPGMIAQGGQLNQLPIQMMHQLGQNVEGYQQQAANEEYRKYMEAQQLPWTGLNQYAAILQGGPQYGQTSMSGQSQLASGMQGAAGGAALGTATMGPGWGTSIGAVGGGLAGLFG